MGFAEALRDKQSFKVTLPIGKLKALPRHCFFLPFDECVLVSLSLHPCEDLYDVCEERRGHLSTKLLSGVLPHMLGLQNVKTARQIMPGFIVVGGGGVGGGGGNHSPLIFSTPATLSD